MKNNCFDRPIIIISAPRSGSTLLYEVLSKNKHLCSIGGESHAVIEGIPGLNIASRNFESNALDSQNATPEVIATLHQKFNDNLISSNGNSIKPNIEDKVRFLEKTPKNSLRIDFLNQVFPDALFVYLVRDPKDNISSIMQAWRSNRFRTYPQLPGWNGDWSLLLPKNWKTLLNKPLQQIAAFQWISANESIISSLSKLPNNRWKVIRYEQLVDNPSTTVKAICEFCQVPFDDDLAALCATPLPHSKYTLSAPEKNKWYVNYNEIKSVWSSLSTAVKNINATLQNAKLPLFTEQWQDLSLDNSVATVEKSFAENKQVSRNALCPCGSKKRFKHCHGQLN